MQEGSIEMKLIFTTSLSVGIQQLKENLFNELSHDVINLKERALILEVICELCDEISIVLDKCIHEIAVLSCFKPSPIKLINTCTLYCNIRSWLSQIEIRDITI